MRHGYFRARAAWLVIGALGLLQSSAALATLGGGRSTVEDDRVHLFATMRSASAATHQVHSLVAENGTVREFTLPDGTVFAVAWSGPARPDLRQLLGVRFADYQAASAARGPRLTRMPIAIRRPDLVIRSAGRPGAFWGIAYLPQMVPAGFSADDLR